MTISRRRRQTQMSLAVVAGLAAGLTGVHRAHGQQNPNDQTVFLNASDTATTSSFYNGSNFQASSTTYSTVPYSNAAPLAAGTAPTAGYAYVVTGSTAGTGRLNAVGGGTFGGDSLTIIAFNGQANLYNTSASITNAMDTSAALNLSGSANATYNIADLVLANGGAVIDVSRNVTDTLSGTINLVPAGTTLDGLKTTVSGGILDAGLDSNGVLSVTSTLTGAGQLHLISTAGLVPGYIALSGSNANFSGGVLLDNTVGTTSSGSGNFPALGINSPTALGTGTFTILSNGATTSVNLYGPGPIVDNTSSADETLTTNTAQVWNGSFNFLGTHSLNMGTGTVTVASTSTLTVVHSVFTVNSIGGSSTLTVAGQPNTSASGALEVPTLGAITTGLTIANGGTLAFPAASNTPAQLAGYAQSLQSNFAAAGSNTGYFGIDTTGVAGGLYNMSSALPAGSYGLNKVGTGTLRLLAAPQYSGATAIINGTIQLGVTNGLGTAGSFLFLGGADSPTNGTLDLNGYSAVVYSPTGGGNGGLITNTSATPATMTIQPGSTTSTSGSYVGGITGNLSVVVDYNPHGSAPTSTFTLGGTFNYTGTTTLRSGILTASTVPALAKQSVFFSGGTLELGAGGLDFSPLFSQAAGQQYDVLPDSVNQAANTVFASGLNSSGGSLTVGSTAVNFAGTLVLAAANHYTGATVVNTGTLVASHPAALAGTSGVTIATTGSNLNPTFGSNVVAATLSVNDGSGTVGLSGAATGGSPIPLTLNGLGAASNSIYYTTGIVGFNAVPHYEGFAVYGALQGTAGGTDVWAGNVVLPSASSGVAAGISGGFNNGSSGTTTGGTLAVTGVISGSGPLTLGLNANSTTVLAAANTYIGETQVNCSTGSATTVQLGANNGVPAVSGLNFESNFAYVAMGVARGTTVTFGTETFDLNRYGTSVAYLTNVNVASSTNDGAPVSGGGFVTQTTPAAIVNSYPGSTSTLTVAGDPNGSFLASPSQVTPVPTFAGAITETAASGKVALAINEAGFAQVLTGASNYSGGTTVVAGKLAANAPQVLSGGVLATSSTGVGPVVVTGTGVLEGTGGTGPVTIAAGGTIGAGTPMGGANNTVVDSVGTLTTGAQAWNAGGGYLNKVTGTATADLLVMSGLTVGATAANPFTVTAQGTGVSLANGASIVIATDVNTPAPSAVNPFLAAILAKTLTLSGASSGVSVPSGDTLALTSGTDAGGYELYLTAAPEPTSLALLTAAAAPLAVGRRRRVRRPA